MAKSLMDQLDGKTLLITGGTGSFGHGFTRAFLKSPLREIRILSRDEKKQEDMREEFDDPKLRFFLGDVRDYQSISDAFKGVDYVFSAAALKQVPSCEFFPLEATKTNVFGSDNVVSACLANHVKSAVFLSTDKAAYPVSAMGITKALMEKNVIARSRNLGPGDAVLSLTRYGNIMATRGSVIPHFLAQIQAGKPITITDPSMTRFLMSMDDAVDLVLYAFLNAEQGDLFVKKAPAVRIDVLAQAVIELTNSKTGIQVIGPRHGEKRFETLVTVEEMSRCEDCGDFFKVKPDNRGLNYDLQVNLSRKESGLPSEYDSENTKMLSLDETKDLLRKLDLFGGPLKS